MFERAASHGGGGSPQNAAARPDLRQLQHDALAEYIERKRGVRRDGGGEQRSGPRPRSANVHAEGNHTGGFDTWIDDRYRQ